MKSKLSLTIFMILIQLCFAHGGGGAWFVSGIIEIKSDAVTIEISSSYELLSYMIDLPRKKEMTINDTAFLRKKTAANIPKLIQCKFNGAEQTISLEKIVLEAEVENVKPRYSFDELDVIMNLRIPIKSHLESLSLACFVYPERYFELSKTPVPATDNDLNMKSIFLVNYQKEQKVAYFDKANHVLNWEIKGLTNDTVNTAVIYHSSMKQHYLWLTAILLMFILIASYRKKYITAVIFTISLSIALMLLILHTNKEVVKPDADTLNAVTEHHVKQLYRASLCKTADSIYDQIEASTIEGYRLSLLINFVNTVRKYKDANATSQFYAIHFKEIESSRIENGVLMVDQDWVVDGLLKHKGHKHLSSRLYKAKLELKDDDGLWKISQVTIKSVEELDEDSASQY